VFLERDDLRLVRSPGCALEWQHPMPTEEALDALYDATYFERWGNVDDPAENAVRDMKRITYGVVLDAIRRHRPGGALLDVGCALGYLVEAARDRGFDAYGLDRNAHAVSAAAERLGDRVYAGELDARAFPGRSFDVVTLTDVVEHVPDPAFLLTRCRERLSEDGLLALLLPNAASTVRRLFGTRWPHYVAEHLFHFGPGNLRRFLAANGFAVEQIVTGFRKAFTGHYLGTYAARVGSFLPPGVGRLGALPIRIPTGEMLVIARRASGESREDGEPVRARSSVA
jgi:SAM-dependent methyltransferase